VGEIVSKVVEVFVDAIVAQNFGKEEL